METQARLRVALYVRVSSDEQKEGHTIDAQIAELRQFAIQKEWPVISVYADEAWSGAALARPKLDQMRDDARKKLFDAVIINDVDRLARDVTHLGIIKRDLERSGVKVIFRKIPSENSPTHNLLVNMLGSFAEFEREMILDRTRRGRLHKVETRQQFIGAIAPFGYRYTPANPNEPAGRLFVNPEEATIVRLMFSWVDEEGLSARDVAQKLTREGYRTRKGGKVWQRSSVLRILRGTIYAGTWFYNKHHVYIKSSDYPRASEATKKLALRRRPREEWIAVAMPKELVVISKDQWERVQRQIDRNRCFSRRNAKHEYLLSSLVRCGGCQGPVCGNPSHGRFSYRCVRRCKRMPQISETILDNAVWGALEAALKDPKLLRDSIKHIADRADSEMKTRSQPDEAIDSIKSEEKRVLEAYRMSIITPEQLRDELAALDSRRKLHEAQKIDPPDVPAIKSVRSGVEMFCAQFHTRLANLTFETKRSALRLLIKQIMYDGSEIEIAGVIPLAVEGGIVTTTPDPYERNSAFDAMFAITAPIPKGLSERALAASLANLAKANESHRFGRVS